MKRIVWLFANALMLIGMMLVGYAALAGVWAGNMAQEYLFWGVGGLVFMVGLGLRNRSE
ncbi:MAG: hypothetical protein KDB07_08305 [Planctomycetes bacterium]|nr:hypothetical protein [Planctomycetota bacterium]